jgi:hypothetical protein
MKLPPYCKQTKKTATISSSSSPPNEGKSVGPTTTSQGKTVFCNVSYAYEAVNSDELTISVGDAVEIVSDDDGSGWIKAKKGDKIGFVPTSYIDLNSSRNNSSKGKIICTYYIVKVLYDYDAESPGDLTIRVGDVITVEKRNEDGWWTGSLNGKRGQFPGR